LNLLVGVRHSDYSPGKHYIRLCTLVATIWDKKMDISHESLALQAERRAARERKKEKKKGHPTE